MQQYVYLKLGYDADKITKESAIAMLNEGGADYPELLSLEELGGMNESIKKIHNKSAKYLNTAREVIEESGWFLPDGMEVLCEINSQGFSYPESINILKEVLHTVNSDYQSDWKLELTKIIAKRKVYIQEYENRENFKRALHQALGIGKKAEETKEPFCCSRMAQAVKGKIFTPIYYDTALTKIEYYSFNFRVDSKLSVCAIVHYCPFCGKKIGVKEIKGENNKRGWGHIRVTVERELKDIDWTIQTLEKILHKYASTGPHSEMASDLSEAKKRKCILLGKLASTDNTIDIIPHWFIGEPDVIQLHNECVDKINELVRAHNTQEGGRRT